MVCVGVNGFSVIGLGIIGFDVLISDNVFLMLVNIDIVILVIGGLCVDLGVF